MDIAGCDFNAEGAEHAESVLENGRLWTSDPPSSLAGLRRASFGLSTRLRPSQDYGGQALDFGLPFGSAFRIFTLRSLGGGGPHSALGDDGVTERRQEIEGSSDHSIADCRLRIADWEKRGTL